MDEDYDEGFEEDSLEERRLCPDKAGSEPGSARLTEASPSPPASPSNRPRTGPSACGSLRTVPAPACSPACGSRASADSLPGWPARARQGEPAATERCGALLQQDAVEAKRGREAVSVSREEQEAPSLAELVHLREALAQQEFLATREMARAERAEELLAEQAEGAKLRKELKLSFGCSAEVRDREKVEPASEPPPSGPQRAPLPGRTPVEESLRTCREEWQGERCRLEGRAREFLAGLRHCEASAQEDASELEKCRRRLEESRMERRALRGRVEELGAALARQRRCEEGQLAWTAQEWRVERQQLQGEALSYSELCRTTLLEAAQHEEAVRRSLVLELEAEQRTAARASADCEVQRWRAEEGERAFRGLEERFATVEVRQKEEVESRLRALRSEVRSLRRSEARLEGERGALEAQARSRQDVEERVKRRLVRELQAARKDGEELRRDLELSKGDQERCLQEISELRASWACRHQELAEQVLVCAHQRREQPQQTGGKCVGGKEAGGARPDDHARPLDARAKTEMTERQSPCVDCSSGSAPEEVWASHLGAEGSGLPIDSFLEEEEAKFLQSLTAALTLAGEDRRSSASPSRPSLRPSSAGCGRGRHTAARWEARHLACSGGDDAAARGGSSRRRSLSAALAHSKANP